MTVRVGRESIVTAESRVLRFKGVSFGRLGRIDARDLNQSDSAIRQTSAPSLSRKIIDIWC